MQHQILVKVSHADPIVAAGLGAALLGQVGVEVSQEDGSGASRPGVQRVIVADYATGLACASAQRAGRSLHEAPPAVLVMTQRHKQWEIRRALEAGVRGYLPLGCAIDELVFAVRALGAGVRHIGADAARLLAASLQQEALTPREAEVLSLVVEGCGNKAIARALEVGVGTVKTHLRSIYAKLDATTRTEAVAMAERRGLLDRASEIPVAAAFAPSRESRPQTIAVLVN